MPASSAPSDSDENNESGLLSSAPTGRGELYRRLTYLMLFRTVLISLVLGTTILLSWLSDVDLASSSSFVLFLVIGFTYLLSLIYSLAMRFGYEPATLGVYQLAGDLVVTTALVHVTGGAQSAFTFFFPLSIVGAAALYFRRGAIIVAGFSLLLFVGISLLGFTELIPMPSGSRVIPSDQDAVSFARSLGLNVAAILGLAFLADNLGAQLQRASVRLETQRWATADLLSLHRDIVRSLPTGLITIDLEGSTITANRAAADILDVPGAQLVHRSISAILPEADLGELEQRMGELTEVRRGKRILGVRMSPLFDHRDKTIGMVLNVQDLTKLRQMEAEIKRTERLAAIGQLAAGIAHEIRNPLASISGSVELLRTSPEADEESKTLMDIVNREIDRLNSLITELLDYTTSRPLERAPFDLGRLVHETASIFAGDKNFDHVDIVVDAPGEGPEIDADSERVRQILWNLLRNAAEATRDTGGTVRVTLTTNDRVELHVIDDGTGISPDEVERIFDPFFTTKASGSGLGLAAVQKIVDEHGGTISVTSNLGEGSDFCVTLPLTSLTRPSSE